MHSNDATLAHKYLKTYAEDDATSALSGLSPDDWWDHVVGIPAVGEYQYLPGALASLQETAALSEKKIICILLINARESAPPNVHQSNAQLLKWLQDNTTNKRLLAEAPSVWLARLQTFDVLVLERCHAPTFIPEKQGVGLVRKILGDVAIRLWINGHLRSEIMHQTDADARLPQNFFHIESEYRPGIAVMLQRYQHIPDPSNPNRDASWSALQLYEIWLRYYVLGLRFANSIYAFPTIGSLVSYRMSDYVKARGFPRREAGEDFYFLNKMRKLGQVRTTQNTPVNLLCRDSDRVPFGTGQGMAKIEELHLRQKDYRVYHPSVFVALKTFIAVALDLLSQPDHTADLSSIFAQYELPTELRLLLIHLSEEWEFVKNVRAARQRSRTQEGATMQFFDWFDAFRTLKFIHTVRDRYVGELPILEAVESAHTFGILPKIPTTNPTITEILDFLRNCEESEITP